MKNSIKGIDPIFDIFSETYGREDKSYPLRNVVPKND
jgi:hypothetical protein